MNSIFIKESISPSIIIKNWDILYKFYVKYNPDVQHAGYIDQYNSLRHFIKYGYKEGKSFGFDITEEAITNLRNSKLANNSLNFTNSDITEIFKSTNLCRSEKDCPYIESISSYDNHYEVIDLLTMNKIPNPNIDFLSNNDDLLIFDNEVSSPINNDEEINDKSKIKLIEEFEI